MNKGKKVKAKVINITTPAGCGDCCNCNGNKCKKNNYFVRILGCRLLNDICTDSTEWETICHNICFKSKKSIATISLSANGTGNPSSTSLISFRVVVNCEPVLFTTSPQLLTNNQNVWNINLSGPLNNLCTSDVNYLNLEWKLLSTDNGQYAKINSESEPELYNMSFSIQYY